MRKRDRAAYVSKWREKMRTDRTAGEVKRRVWTRPEDGLQRGLEPLAEGSGRKSISADNNA